MKKFIFIFGGGIVLTTILFLFVFFSQSDGKLHLVICDVGQGDAIFIRTPEGLDVLIDGGPDKKVLDCLARHMSFWDKTLEAVILTHPDADHITGLVDVIKRYYVISFYTQANSGRTQIYKLFESTLAEKKLSARFVMRGDVLGLGEDIELDIISPASNTPL